MNTVKVIIAHYNENLCWVTNLKYPFIIISKNGIQKETPPNRGNEAATYLEYIIKNYNDLSDISIFIHAHQYSWHNHIAADITINKLTFEYDYYNINDISTPEYIDVPSLKELCHGGKILLNANKQIIEGGIKQEIDVEKIKYRPSAMFYVKRENILKYPVQVYNDWYGWLMTRIDDNLPKINIGNLSPSDQSGRVFEYTWHIIFTGNMVDIQ